MINIKKRYISLLELMIAISLTLIILTTLSFFYDQTFRINRKMDAAQNEAFKLLYVETRLANVFPKIFAPSENKDIEFIFFTTDEAGKGQNLIFSFDNNVKLDKTMSFNVIGRLYLDEKGNLILATWPARKRWKEGELPTMKKEILVENIDSLQFQFFDLEDELKGWVSVWPKDKGKKLPPVLKVILKRKDEEIVYAYHMPNCDKTVTYNK